MAEEKSGFVERKVPGKKKGAFMWFTLLGSSLFCYKEKHSSTTKATYEIKNCTISTPTDKRLTLDISNSENKLILSLLCTSKDEYDGWKSALETAISLDPVTAPVKEKTKKDRGTIVSRAGRSVGGMVASTAVGKSTIKVVVSEEITLLINSLKRIVGKIVNAKKAEEIENNVMKILTKVYFLEKDHKVSLDEILSADDPLRQAFELLVELRDLSYRMRPETRKQRLAIIHAHLVEVETILTNLLTPYLQPKSIQRIATTFGLLSSEEFLEAAWGDETLVEERDLLVDAMNRYTQFHF